VCRYWWVGESLRASTRKGLESLNIRVQGVTQLRSGRRDQYPAKHGPPKPHLIVSVARGPGVSKVLSLTEVCDLRVTVKSCEALKRVLDKGSVTADRSPGSTRMGAPMPYPTGTAPVLNLHGQTRRTTGAVLSGTKRMRLLQSRRLSVDERTPPKASLPPRNLNKPGPMPRR